MKRPTRLQKWWYRRGHRPKPGSRLYSPALVLQYAAMEAVFGLKYHIAETQRRMGIPESEFNVDLLCTCDAIEYGAMAQHLKPCPLYNYVKPSRQ